MRIAIIGVGALGSLFAAYLQKVTDVTMIGYWPQQRTAIRQQGITVEQPNGRFTTPPLTITNTPHTIPPVDLALILVKSRQTSSAAHLAQQLLSPTGIALTLQNGLGNQEKIAAILKDRQVALGTTAQGATMLAPGHIRHAGHGPTHIALSGTTAVPLQTFAHHLQQVGFTCQLVAQVDSLIWGKLVINCAINPLTALLRVPNGTLAQDPLLRQLMMAVAQETAVVAHAHNISLPFADAGQRALEVAQATATNHSSMLQDVLRGVPTEIDAICGAVVQYGRLTQTPTPLNQTLRHLIHTQTPEKTITLHTILTHLAQTKKEHK